ncbi:MAG: hypothetical protein GY832_12700 [Chloroflexi bacterium]|nr:hypothetical protein [Chloroflexota bacterium]
MFSDRIRQLAQDFGATQEAWRKNPTNDELGVRTSEAYDQFVAQLEADDIPYSSRDDAVRIATGIVSGAFDVRYHRCGQAVIRDGDVVKILGGRLTGRVIDRCPKCQKHLDAFRLYADPGGATRDLLREAGLYPTADGLVLAKGSGRRDSILQEMAISMDKLGDGDMLAVYAVVIALLNDSVGDQDSLRPPEPTIQIVEM